MSHSEMTMMMMIRRQMTDVKHDPEHGLLVMHIRVSSLFLHPAPEVDSLIILGVLVNVPPQNQRNSSQALQLCHSGGCEVHHKT